MIGLITAILLYTNTAQAYLPLQTIRRTVFHVDVGNHETGEDVSGGTGFAVKVNNKTYLVTNNHICDLFIKGIPYINRTDKKCDLLWCSANKKKPEYVTQAYRSPYADICLIKSDSIERQPALELSEDDPDLLQHFTVMGFLYRDSGAKVAEGRFYETGNEQRSGEAKKCSESKTMADVFICEFFDTFPSRVTYNYIAGSANVGPGFSGSPALDQDGKVIGVVYKYYIPSSSYANGDAMVLPVSLLKKTIKSAKFVSIKDPSFKESVVRDIAHNSMVNLKKQLDQTALSGTEKIIKFLSGSGYDMEDDE